jgi:hypothetical protein
MEGYMNKVVIKKPKWKLSELSCTAQKYSTTISFFEHYCEAKAYVVGFRAGSEMDNVLATINGKEV